MALMLLAPLAILAAQTTTYHQLGRDILRELVETDTTHSTGDTTKAAEALARRFRDAGFPEADVVVIGPRSRNQNLVVRFRGTGAQPPVVLLAHLDVVEARRADWSFDPFKLTEEGGFFYGRGTSDDKDGVAALSATLLRLRQEQFKPNRDLILALTAGEEGGRDDNGASWLLTNHNDLVKGSICLNADAGGPEKRHGKLRMYTVQAAEKVFLSFRLESKSPGGHSSLPTKDNPISRVAAGLVRLSQFEFPVRLNEITRGYFEKMISLENPQTAADMKAVLANPPDPDGVRRLSATPLYNALLRTTAVATMIEGGHAENALPQTAWAIVNCRMLPGESAADVQETLRRVLADEQISLAPVEPALSSPASPLASEVMRAIERAKEKIWPGLPVVPVMETGATDGLYFRRAGIPTFGISGSSSDVDDIRAHGKDERIAVADFYNALEFDYQLVKTIAQAEP